MGSVEASRRRLLVSVDLEEWSDARIAAMPIAARERLPRGLEGPVDRLLDILEASSARATFFALGRVARRYPALLRRIARRHEVATHGDAHEDLRRLDAARLAADVRVSRARLEDLTGHEVLGYRAPDWSLAGCMDWAVPVLEDEGLSYDSSLIPGRGLLFVKGVPSTARRPHRLAGRRGLWEFPPTVLRLPGCSLPAGGGAFLRVLPGRLSTAVLERAAARGELPHLHLHPWEMEAGIPEAAPLVGRTRSRLLFAGAGSVEPKLRALLRRFQGTAIEQVWRELSRGEGAPAPRGASARVTP